MFPVYRRLRRTFSPMILVFVNTTAAARPLGVRSLALYVGLVRALPVPPTALVSSVRRAQPVHRCLDACLGVLDPCCHFLQLYRILLVGRDWGCRTLLFLD
ncbi:hypothetical protein BDZ85DRAFT_266498 [Elsinoe ampelina]|uniref:Uncharacterized protein n=1 Tax=Elsinoe ampelina TaxID=302913 RepID=A0A6A6G6R6_9PEZI|nr:hypothetical protein BDZ85DRAFT_266498 [Elsinoe ampelina]